MIFSFLVVLVAVDLLLLFLRAPVNLLSFSLPFVYEFVVNDFYVLKV